MEIFRFLLTSFKVTNLVSLNQCSVFCCPFGVSKKQGMPDFVNNDIGKKCKHKILFDFDIQFIVIFKV